MAQLFTIRTANEWLETAAQASRQKSIYRNLWHEGELVCLMDKASVDKSALAIGIAREVSREHTVLLIDFCTPLRRFAARNPDRFSDTLLRLQIDRGSLVDLDPDTLVDRLEEAVESSGAKICIIDSLSWLVGYFRKSDAARWFMRRIDAMRRRLGLSVLIVSDPAKRIAPFLDNTFSAVDLDPAETQTQTPAEPAAGPQRPLFRITRMSDGAEVPLSSLRSPVAPPAAAPLRNARRRP